MKRIILASLLLITSFKALAGFTPISAAGYTKNMLKFSGYSLNVIQKLDGEARLENVGDVKVQLILIEEVKTVKNKTQKIRSVLLNTNDGINSYYFKIADGHLIKNLKSLKQGSGSVVEIDLEQVDGKTSEINTMLMVTEREDQSSSQNLLKVFHIANIMDQQGYKRK